MKKVRKIQKELKRRYGVLAKSMGPFHDHIDLRFFNDLDDDGFAFIMNSVKGVNMLDLNGTEITNESIRFLNGLEYVYELRVKDCTHLDNDCIQSLSQLTELRFLHVKDTRVTIEGLLQIRGLDKLEKLMFSAIDVEAITDKMIQLRNLLPNCAFVINSRPYEFIRGPGL